MNIREGFREFLGSTVEAIVETALEIGAHVLEGVIGSLFDGI